jgi:hypothetical protein
VGLKLDGTHYADDVNLLGDNIDTMKEKTETLIDSSKEVGLEINIAKTKYMLLSRNQNAGRNRDVTITNRSFENVSQFKYLWTTVTNHILIQEENVRGLNSSNACYQDCKSIILPVVLYECETSSLT